MSIKPVAWTDYPITALGDKPYVEAPIREITLLSYDGDKYVTVSTEDGSIHEIKAGYCYTKPGRSGEVPTVPLGIIRLLART